jgi:hypothetical protein
VSSSVTDQSNGIINKFGLSPRAIAPKRKRARNHDSVFEVDWNVSDTDLYEEVKWPSHASILPVISAY